MKYYIIAGEASGDLHASNLVREIRKKDTDASFRGWGGDLMASQGVDLVKHYKEVAFMGFLEVALHLKTILRAMKQCKKDILEYRPDAIILVDYPGFNLRMAEFAHRHHIRVIYYISPQVWAWKRSRVHKIRKNVDKMLVILPFEEDFYRRYGFPVTFVGHPLLDAVGQPSTYHDREEFLKENNLPDRPIIALLPGSRKQEITRMLPTMASMKEHFPEYEFVVAAAPSQDIRFYRDLMPSGEINVLSERTHEVLRFSKAALVTSGTATLETALFEVPEVVCYKASTVSYHIAKRLVKVNYISLVNLIMNREVVKELIQDEYNERNLKRELERILDPQVAAFLQGEFRHLKELLGKSGASEHAAREITGFMKVC
jgi:lipid-A-disaccharide synthase